MSEKHFQPRKDEMFIQALHKMKKKKKNISNGIICSLHGCQALGWVCSENGEMQQFGLDA
jgi:hypothetical protein